MSRQQEHNVLDYDDLLLYWAQAVSEPQLADDIGGDWDHVLVDEYQGHPIACSLDPAGPQARRPRPYRGRR